MTTKIDPKLSWLCRRGMKELDEILKSYLENDYLNATEKEKQAFTKLLTYQDPDIIDRLFYKQKDDNPDIELLLEKLRF